MYAAVLSLLLGTGSQAEGADFIPDRIEQPSASVIETAHIYNNVKNIRKNLELLRQHMGAPEADRFPVEITESLPHDVYLQALSLMERINRLSFDISRRKTYLPAPLKTTGEPESVLQLIEKSRDTLHRVLESLDIQVQQADEAQTPSVTQAMVLSEILQANRQVNLLVSRPISSSDVYTQLVLAVDYAARLISTYSDVSRIPPMPRFEKGKTPADVFRRLIICHDIAASIVPEYHHNRLLISDFLNPENITPSDNYDLANMLIAHLDFLLKKRDYSRLPRDPFYPGHKQPSDTYQLSGLLLKQLELLDNLVAKGN